MVEIGGKLTRAVLVTCALALLVAQPASAGRFKTGSDQFGVRTSTSSVPAIPGTALNLGPKDGDAYKTHERLVLNSGGGGAALIDVTGQERPPCNVASQVAEVMRTNISLCSFVGDQRLTLIDLSVVPKGHRPSSAAPPYSGSGERVGDLHGRRQVLRGLSQQTRVIRAAQPAADNTSVEFVATVSMLSNPNASLSTRRILISSLAKGAGVKSFDTPSGATGGLMLNEPAHAESATVTNGLESVTYDLSRTRLRHTIEFDRNTLEIVTERYLLVKTDVPEISRWLREQGRAISIYTERTRPIEHLRIPRQQQRSVPCRKLNLDIDPNPDRTCIQIGEPGGAYILTGG